MEQHEPTTEEIVKMVRELEVSDIDLGRYSARIEDAADRLEQLQRENAELTDRAERAEKERDAAIKDAEELMRRHLFADGCFACLYDGNMACPERKQAGTCNPKWRGAGKGTK